MGEAAATAAAAAAAREVVAAASAEAPAAEAAEEDGVIERDGVDVPEARRRATAGVIVDLDRLEREGVMLLSLAVRITRDSHPGDTCSVTRTSGVVVEGVGRQCFQAGIDGSRTAKASAGPEKTGEERGGEETLLLYRRFIFLSYKKQASSHEQHNSWC